MINLRVERQRDDCYKEEWQFALVRETRLVLTGYSIITRPNTRKRFKVEAFWNTYNRRDSKLAKDDVTLPDDVAAEAKQQLIDKIVIARDFE